MRPYLPCVELRFSTPHIHSLARPPFMVIARKNAPRKTKSDNVGCLAHAVRGVVYSVVANSTPAQPRAYHHTRASLSRLRCCWWWDVIFVFTATPNSTGERTGTDQVQTKKATNATRNIATKPFPPKKLAANLLVFETNQVWPREPHHTQTRGAGASRHTQRPLPPKYTKKTSLLSCFVDTGARFVKKATLVREITINHAPTKGTNESSPHPRDRSGRPTARPDALPTPPPPVLTTQPSLDRRDCRMNPQPRLKSSNVSRNTTLNRLTNSTTAAPSTLS